MFSFIASVYHALIFQPLFNALVVLYNTIALGDLGVAIILLTTLLRIAFFPLTAKRTRYQAVMQKIQPKLKEIQAQHKENPEKQTAAMMALYREHGTNPFSGILLVFAEIPFLIGLYQIFSAHITQETLVHLYSFVPHPAQLSTTLLGLLNLSESSILMVSLAALAQYFQARTMMTEDAMKGPGAQAAKITMVIAPFMTLLVFWSLPAALTLYWFTSGVITAIQQVMINKKSTNGTNSRIYKESHSPNGLS